ncbi:hypothetical protein OJ997_15300 [Solirubrobacter phytolaccae]|uniref:Uncharacterized protein n=1 Tax=Solirubrobacter phytolaccae TaxID=1404360 RepID=A0A9X3S9N5_9ACTN|nr:hypothetical protein [Solirubrobacter phytolaccae]MDA0181671.1 hypothetical protein [Solirubrobacter phytolaccae]
MRLSPLALVLTALALPATAQADSISYIKGGDVWIASPDGSNQTRITTSGAYKAVSQGDDGTLVAVSDRDLYRLDRTTGAVLNEINTPLGIGWFGPWEPAVSPDGTKVAYELRDINGYPAVAYSNTDGSIQSRPLHTGWTWPSWIDNTWLVHSEKPNALAEDTIVRAVGSPNNEGTPWFTHPGRTPLADVDIKGDLFAGITNDTILTVFRFTGEPGTGAVDGCFQYENPSGGKFTGPAFSPDARALVWGEGDGIWRGDMPNLSGGCIAPPDGRLIIPGAYNPDWSPAAVPVPQTPPPPAPPAPPAPPVPVPPAAKPMTLSTAKQSLKTALKQGITVTLANATAKTKVTASYKKKVVASGTGTTKVTLKFTKKAAKDLKRKRSVKLTLKAGAVTKTLTLK